MRFFYITISIFFFLTAKVYSDVSKKIINNLEKANNYSFKFIQQINKNKETGYCILVFNRKINCRYDVSGKVLVSDGKNLIIKSKKLSGGERKRLTIALSLLSKPRILLLDEPFAALDNLSREIISTELVSIIKKNSLTVLMVTHSIEEAALLSDEVLVTGMAPLRVINKFNPPKSFNNQSWQNLGLRKSLQDKSFNGYLKSIRDTSYSVLQKEK